MASGLRFVSTLALIAHFTVASADDPIGIGPVAEVEAGLRAANQQTNAPKIQACGLPTNPPALQRRPRTLVERWAERLESASPLERTLSIARMGDCGETASRYLPKIVAALADDTPQSEENSGLHRDPGEHEQRTPPGTIANVAKVAIQRIGNEAAVKALINAYKTGTTETPSSFQYRILETLRDLYLADRSESELKAMRDVEPPLLKQQEFDQVRWLPKNLDSIDAFMSEEHPAATFPDSEDKQKYLTPSNAVREEADGSRTPLFRVNLAACRGDGWGRVTISTSFWKTTVLPFLEEAAGSATSANIRGAVQGLYFLIQGHKNKESQRRLLGRMIAGEKTFGTDFWEWLQEEPELKSAVPELLKKILKGANHSDFDFAKASEFFRRNHLDEDLCGAIEKSHREAKFDEAYGRLSLVTIASLFLSPNVVTGEEPDARMGARIPSLLASIDLRTLHPTSAGDGNGMDQLVLIYNAVNAFLNFNTDNLPFRPAEAVLDFLSGPDFPSQVTEISTVGRPWIQTKRGLSILEGKILGERDPLAHARLIAFGLSEYMRSPGIRKGLETLSGRIEEIPPEMRGNVLRTIAGGLKVGFQRGARTSDDPIDVESRTASNLLRRIDSIGPLEQWFPGGKAQEITNVHPAVEYSALMDVVAAVNLYNISLPTDPLFDAKNRFQLEVEAVGKGRLPALQGTLDEVLIWYQRNQCPESVAAGTKFFLTRIRE